MGVKATRSFCVCFRPMLFPATTRAGVRMKTSTSILGRRRRRWRSGGEGDGGGTRGGGGDGGGARGGKGGGATGSVMIVWRVEKSTWAGGEMGSRGTHSSLAASRCTDRRLPNSSRCAAVQIREIPRLWYASASCTSSVVCIVFLTN